VTESPDAALLARIETYLDAAPRTAAEPEEVGKFTLFRPLGPWPFYARPRLGLDEPISRADVDQVRQRQRDLKLPQSFEWVVQTTPSLADAAEQSGLMVQRYPLMVLERESYVPPDLTLGFVLRYIGASDREFARVHAVASVGFGVAGTQVGGEGTPERDASALESPPAVLQYLRERARRGLSITAAAVDDEGPVAVGTHQPLGGVSEVVGVATLPALRRRGLGGAVTAALVEEAWSRGVELVFLSAGSEDVARVYARLGFRQIGFAGAAETPAPSGERVSAN
jgi:GNAT superfamily N-acetyltransferase